MWFFNIAFLTAGSYINQEGCPCFASRQPSRNDGGDSIQTPYVSKFSSVWEYSEAVFSKKIDWAVELADGCCICGKRDCWRQITSYPRQVVELFPYKAGWVWIPRFLCGKTKTTFSLLPIWLVPYHKYTVTSMVFALLLAMGKSFFSVAENELDAECNANGWLLLCWQKHCVRGLRRSHVVLTQWHDLGHAQAGPDELSSYCKALGIRGPPSCSGLHEVIKQYAQNTQRFLIGIPSQDRPARGAS